MGAGELDHGRGAAVAELQGLDGAFSFAERLLQRIWLRGDFDRARAVTAAGAPVRVLSPGRWNRLAGPDFSGARLEIDGERKWGDVELHLHAGDWKAHGHSSDSRYANVILHVVLFPPQTPWTAGVGEIRIPVLSLLPLLYRSLEEYAEEDAVERLAGHPLTRAHEALLALSSAEQRAELGRCTAARWQQKRRFAQRRVELLGFEEACHQTALEVLGYRFNRGPMLALAAERDLTWWREEDRTTHADQLFEHNRPRWNTQAVRPANHPRQRLRQYAAWVRAVPDWPERARRFVLPDVAGQDLTPTSSTRQHRAAAEFARVRDRIARDLCGGALGGTRLQTWICDGLWPLLAIERPELEPVIEILWRHWYPGDIPENVARLLSALQLTDAANWPACHGTAQGFLAWVWREEERRDQTAAC